jgi:threonine-phosphate decarboxylase
MVDPTKPEKAQLQDVPYPIHGGNPPAVAESSGVDPDKLIDFSASINPLSPPGCVSQLLLETPRLLREYPDPNCSLITERISEVTGIPENWIRVTNGSTEMIYLLPHLLHEGQEVAILDPCFSEYEKSFRAFGTQPHSIVLEAGNGFSSSPSWLFSQLETIQKLGAIVLGNPASPTGKLYGGLLPKLQKYCQNRDIILIIDEAFIDFSSADNSAWNLLERDSNLILIRSLTKFYSIPGLRVGYGVLHPEKIQKIAPRQYPWSVNALAQAIGAEIILDRPFQDKTRAETHRERNFMNQALSSINEIEVFPSDANFLLFRIRDNSPPANLYQYLLSHSLLIRNCGNFRGLDESFFRISLRSRDENQKLVDSIAEYFLFCKQDFKT